MQIGKTGKTLKNLVDYNIYSNQKKKIGVYIEPDGKRRNIYKTTLYFNGTGQHNGSFRLCSEPIDDLYAVVDMYGEYMDNSGLSNYRPRINAPAISGISYGCTAFHDVSNDRIWLEFGGSAGDVSAALHLIYTDKNYI